MKTLDIGELSARAGVPTSTLRYYDEIGLVQSIGRHGLRRQFGPEAEWQLALIRSGQRAGFSLKEIAAIFAAGGPQMKLPRVALEQRAEALDRQIYELKALRDMVRHVASCSAPSHLECSRFRKMLKVAARL